jgi:hypothetical protein
MKNDEKLKELLVKLAEFEKREELGLLIKCSKCKEFLFSKKTLPAGVCKFLSKATKIPGDGVIVAESFGCMAFMEVEDELR